MIVFWIVWCAVFALYDAVLAFTAASNGDTGRVVFYAILTLVMVGCGYVNVRLERDRRRRRAELKQEADRLNAYLNKLKA